MDDLTRRRMDRGEDKCEFCGKWLTAAERVVVEDADTEDRYPACRPCAKAAHAEYLRRAAPSAGRPETP